MKETVNELVRSADGPYVSVELDDSLDVWHSFPSLTMFVVGCVTAVFSLNRHIVRVGINRGPRLELSSHRYKDRETALRVAQRLVDEVHTIGLPAVTDWNDDPEHWITRVNL